MKGRRVTIRDVAELAGCGAATVSRVLNRSGPASAETRARVLAAAETLGFRFNELGRSLQSSRSRTLGIVVPNVVNPVFAAAIQGVQAAAAEHGYHTLLACSDNDSGSEAAVAGTLAGKQVDGAVLTVVDPDRSEALAILRAAGIPYCLMVNQPTVREPSVGIDNAAAAALAAEKLVASGHVETAFVAPRSCGSERAGMRARGFAEALRRAGRPPPARLVVDDLGEGTLAALSGLLDARPGVTGVFATNDFLALACLSAAHRLGVEVPEALSVVGLGSSALTELVAPSVAAVTTPTETMGQGAAEAVIGAIDSDRPVAPARRFLEVAFREGASLAAPRDGPLPRTVRLAPGA